MKRFWDTASIAPADAGYTILLDGRPMHLPGGAVLRIDHQSLALAIADEWQAAGGGKGGEMSFADAPLTRLAGTALHRVAPDPLPVVDAIARYAESDLAMLPRGTASTSWSRGRCRHGSHGWTGLRRPTTPLRVGSGIAYVKQHRSSVGALRTAVAALDVPALAALGVVVPALGSLVLGLAMAEGRLDAASAHELGALDELFQAEAWGEDAEASARRAAIAADVALAARFLQLTRPEARA